MDVSFADQSNGWVVGFYGDVFHTANGGLTWQRQTVQGAGDTAFLGIEAISPTTAWISGGPMNGFVARTTDGGVTWTREALPGAPLSIGALAFLSPPTRAGPEAGPECGIGRPDGGVPG